tara:strand:+ start:1611 stop:1850 length:240 start_codon:yes stop_codon:yes gene_type:complete
MRFCLVFLAVFKGIFNPVHGQEFVIAKPDKKVSFGFAREHVGKDRRYAINCIMDGCAMFRSGMKNDDTIISIDNVQMTW